MYRSDLRTYGLSAVLTVLLGAGMGFGWNYFVDRAGERAGASAATPPAQKDAPSGPSPNPVQPREGPALDVLRTPGLSEAQQPTRNMALDLSDHEKLALVALLNRTIVHDRHPLSPRVRTLKDVLTKLDPKPPVQPASKMYAPPGTKRAGAPYRE
jgi:hypothetical protein